MVSRASRRPLYLTLACAWLTAACEQCAPGLVGQGVSRLTIRNAGAVAELVNNDTRCGFESPAVLASAEVTGASSMPGSATWTVTDCEIDLVEQPSISTDCNGVSTTIRGKLIVSAKKTITGVVTGDEAQPVIPGGPDAVTLELIDVRHERFAVESSDSDAILTVYSGELSGLVRPLLARSAELGVCKIPTKHVAFEGLRWKGAQVHVHNSERDFEVPVPSSRLDAVNGRIGDAENTLTGEITVWDSLEPIPTDGDGDGLNPDYDPERHAASFACEEDLALPVSHTCDTEIGPKLAQGAARLTVRNAGTLADRLDKDTRCGFSSPAVLGSAVASGPIGSLGSVTMTVTGCTLDFAPGTVAETSCTGSERKVAGRVTASATKTLTGRITGNLEKPVVPMTDSPAIVELRELLFDGFEVEEKGTALRWESGALSGRILPRVAADASQKGACAFETPIARFDDLRYTQPSKVRLRSGSGSFGTTIDSSSLDALNGSWDGVENELTGTISIGGETYVLPVDPADPGLDPEFDREAFDREWQCGALELPPRFDCRFDRPIAQGAAQLGVKVVGTLVKLLDADRTCGFASTRVLESAAITGEVGAAGGAAVLTVSRPCELSFEAEHVAETDCNGKETRVRGRARVTGTKTIRGYVSGDLEEPIVPVTRDPAEITIHAELEDLRVWTVPGDDAITARRGVISGTVRPRLAIDTETGACSIPTPVATLSDVRWQDAEVRVESEGKVFDVVVSSSTLEAQNGSKDGVTNRLTGTITMDGVTFPVPAYGGPLLDPDYNQRVFDASFACTPNQRLPEDDAACNMREVLANGAARLVVLSLGSVSRMVNADDDCGFDARSVLTNPTQVVGDVGDQGSMSWEIEGCTLTGSSRTPAAVDCLGRETWVTGAVDVDAARTVRGLRNEVVILIIIRFDSIIPSARDAVSISFRNLDLRDFYVREREPGQVDASRGLLIRSGSMSAEVRPILGENAAERGTFDVPTPIAHMSRISLANADARVTYEGKRFNVRIDSADLEAFNGSWSGMNMTNLIRGSIVLDGQRFEVTPNMLDPDYSQADFDARYACTEDLVGLVEHAP